MGQTLEYLLKLQDQFSSPLKQARDEQGRFIAGTKKMGDGAGAVNNLGSAFTGLATKIGAAFTAYKALEAGFSGFKHSLSVASAMETTQTAFKTMLGSSGAMLETLGEIKKLAMSTPFEFPELANAGKMLLAFGEAAEDIPDTLRRIGDVSSAIAAPIAEIAEIYGKARTQGQLFAEDINQLTGRGIPIIREFAKILGLPEGAIKKLAEEGKITFPLLDQAFRNLTGNGGQFFNMMAEQAKTSAGLWSTLKDGVNELFLAMGTPLNDAIKPVLEDAIGLADQLKPSIAELGTHMGTALSAVRNFIAEAQTGSGMAGAMGKALQDAFMGAAKSAMIPLEALGAGLPALGKGLMAIFQPAGEWLMAKLESAALSFSSKIMVGIRDALKAMSESSFMASMIPGLGAAADSLNGPAAMAQNDAENANNRAGRIGAAMPDFAKEAMAAFDESMGAVRGKWNERMAPKEDPYALPPSVLDKGYNPMFPNGVLPPGAKPGKSSLPPSVLDWPAGGGAPVSILEELASKAGSKPAPAGGNASGVDKAISDAKSNTDTAGKKERAAKKLLQFEDLGNKILEAKIAGNKQLEEALAHQLRIAREIDSLTSKGVSEAEAKTRAEKNVGLKEKVDAINQMSNSANIDPGMTPRSPFKGPMGDDGEGAGHKIRGYSQAQGGRRMGMGDGGPLSGRRPTPTVPSPGTARRSQERREAAATASKSSGEHPLASVIKDIQVKLNTLAVAK